MDKNFVIAILLTTAIILIYTSPFYQKRYRKELPRKADVEQSSVDTLISKRSQKAPVFVPGDSKTSEIMTKSSDEQDRTEEPEETSTLTQINPPSYEKNIILENDDVRISISSRGGVINEAVLKNFNAKTKDEPVQLVTEGQSWYSGFIQDGDIVLDTSDLLFSVNLPSENKAILEAEISGNKFISKEFNLNTSGYILEARTNVSGDWNDPILHFAWYGPINDTEIKFKQLKIPPFSLFMRDESTVHNKLVYLGDGEHTLSSNGKPKSVNSSKSQKLDARKEENGSDKFVGDIDWFAVKNKYFMTAAIPHDRKHWSVSSRFSRSDKSGKWFDFTITKRVSNGVTDFSLVI